MKKNKGDAVSLFVLLAIGITIVAGYINHIMWSYTVLLTNHNSATQDIAVSVIGAFIFPLGMLHGIWLWF